jgi:peptidoglycan hydrolase-like protein with peptidoglycan-binding domain
MAPTTRPTRWARAATALSSLALLVTGLAVSPPAGAANAPTPGGFTGYGFDQCLAPTQRAMDAWLNHSPFWSAGIYISGASRGCPDQPNLTPTWVRTQLANGWRLLPITLGPQAWCTTRDRYLRQERISPRPERRYARARAQGRAEAAKTVRVAQRLGLERRSTLWYDLEAFNISPTDCRESALSFLHAWTRALHQRGYVSGVYSSAASGITMLDDARALRPGTYTMPDQVWIADWNGRRDTSSSYVRSDGWRPHRRVHQYVGGHNETHGGVTINIDRNWLNVGGGSVASREPAHCGGAASFNFRRYPRQEVGDRGALVRTVQCLLSNKGRYSSPVDGVYDAALGEAVSRYRVSRGLAASPVTSRRTWVALLSQGAHPIVKYGSASRPVRRLQRALNAADGAGLRVTGFFNDATVEAVRDYQRGRGRAATGVANRFVWRPLLAGRL